MARPFFQSRLKISRAEQHTADVAGVVEEYVGRAPMFSKERVIGDYVHYEIHLVEDPPEMLSTMIGDAIHNLRSSLDLLACELVRLNGASRRPFSVRKIRG